MCMPFISVLIMHIEYLCKFFIQQDVDVFPFSKWTIICYRLRSLKEVHYISYKLKSILEKLLESKFENAQFRFIHFFLKL